MKTIVLGGGVIGTTTAYYLAKLGHEVHLVDRQEGVALETSFANGGVLHTSEAEPWSRPGMPTNIWKWLGKEDAPDAAALQRAAGDVALGARVHAQLHPRSATAAAPRSISGSRSIR